MQVAAALVTLAWEVIDGSPQVTRANLRVAYFHIL
jgi:hypothetical protein